jgi:hypothetical protein
LSRRKYAGPPKQDGIRWVKLFSAGVSDADFDKVVERQVRVSLDALRVTLAEDGDFTDAQRQYALTKAEPLIRESVRIELEKGRQSLLH